MYRLCSDTSKIVWFLECLQQGVLWSSIFWVFKLSRVNFCYEFPKFPPQIWENFLKILEEWIFPSFSSSIVVQIEVSNKSHEEKKNGEKVRSIVH